MDEAQTHTLEELTAPGESITYGVVKPGDDPCDGVLFIRGGDIKDGNIALSALRRISSDVSDQYRRTLLRGGELLVSLVGNPGEVAIVPSHLAGANIARQVGLVRLNDDTDARFIKYFLMSPIGRSELGAQSIGSVQSVINLRDLKKVKVPSICIAQQRAIANVLSSLDDKIELNRRKNETLETMAQAIFRDWFVDFGPVRRKMAGATDPQAILGGLTSDPAHALELAVLFPDMLGDNGLPVGWAEKAIGELAEIVGGSTPSTDAAEYWNEAGHSWATPKDLSKLAGIYLFDTERSISDAGLAKVGSGLSPTGSVLLSSRAPIGYLAIASAPVAVNQGFIVLRPTPEFPTLMAYFWCKSNMDLIKGNANGSTFQEISKRNFRPLPALALPTDILAAFQDVAGPAMDLIEIQEGENLTLPDVRDYLLPRLVSGEARVMDAERMAG